MSGELISRIPDVPDASPGDAVDLATKAVERRIPKIERKYFLLYLLAAAGELNKKQLEHIAERLSIAEDCGSPVSLAELLEAAKEVRNRDRPVLFRPMIGPVLHNVALQYRPDEAAAPETLEPGDEIRSVDVWAGRGMARPLLKELYSLEGMGEVYLSRGDHHGPAVSEMSFRPTDAGRALANALHGKLQRARLHKYVAVAGPTGVEVRPRSTA